MVRSPSVEGTGVYLHYLPSACVDIRPSPKIDILVGIFIIEVVSVTKIMMPQQVLKGYHSYCLLRGFSGKMTIILFCLLQL